METTTHPRITKQEAIALFDGVPYRLAKALGINPQAIDSWRDEEIPPLRAYQLRDMFPEEFEKRGTKAA